MRDIASARNEGATDASAHKPRGRRTDPNAQSMPEGVSLGVSAHPVANGFDPTAHVDVVKPVAEGRQAGTWDPNGVGTQHAPHTQPRGSLVDAGGDSITRLLSSMRLGGGNSVNSAPGGLGLESTWAGAAAIDLDSTLGSSSSTSELDSMFDSLMAEQRQLKAERRRSNEVASAPSSFARGLGSANGRWGATQGLGSTQTRRRWGGTPLGTTSNFGPRATRGFASFRSVANSTLASGGYGVAGGAGVGAGGGARRRRTFESVAAPASPGFGPPVAYMQGCFSPMDSMRSGMAAGGLPIPVHVSQEAARAHRRPQCQRPPPSQQEQHHAEDQQDFDYSYSSPGRGVHQSQYGATQPHQPQQQRPQERFQPSGDRTNYYHHEHTDERQTQLEGAGYADELGQTTSSRFLDRGESEQYLDRV